MIFPISTMIRSDEALEVAAVGIGEILMITDLEETILVAVAAMGDSLGIMHSEVGAVPSAIIIHLVETIRLAAVAVEVLAEIMEVDLGITSRVSGFTTFFSE
jgi:hypothetical protein